MITQVNKVWSLVILVTGVMFIMVGAYNFLYSYEEYYYIKTIIFCLLGIVCFIFATKLP